MRSQDLRSVVVYSMGRDGSAPIAHALRRTQGVHLRQVYTLHRPVVAKFILQNPDHIPEHLRLSEEIIKQDIPAENPLYFVTVLHDPFSRHIHHTFNLLKNQWGMDMLRQALSSPNGARSYFESVPATHTTEWFTQEYRAATGLNVYGEAFDPQQEYKIFTLGVHKFLLLSAHASVAHQRQILSAFLARDVEPVLEEVSPFEGILSYFTAQVLSEGWESLVHAFWATPYARHFFSPAQIGDFQTQAREKNKALIHQYDALQKRGKREALLKDALSSLGQVSHLSSGIDALVRARGLSTTRSALESILRQLERAQKNLVLASMRTLATWDVGVAVELGAQWYGRAPDERLIRTLAAYQHKMGEISQPLELLASLPIPQDPQQHMSHQQLGERLASQKRLLAEPYPFSFPKRQQRSRPEGKQVLYHAALALPYHSSGYATRTQGIVKGLRQWGWDVRVMTRKGYPLDTGVPLGQGNTALIDGVPYAYDIHSGEGQHQLPLEGYVEKAVHYLVQQAEQIRPALVHTASNYICGMVGVEAARRLGVPSIYEMRGLWHLSRASKEPRYLDTEHFALAQKMEVETALGADHVLAITGALKKWLIDHGVPEWKISTAPNAVDLERFKTVPYDPAFAEKTGCSGRVVIGYIGSFVQYEGLDFLLRAVALLPSAVRQKIRLLWVGDGPVLEELLRLGAELGVADTIKALGRQPFGDIPRFYSLVDFCVFPRKGQAVCEIVSPLKPFEAMAMQKAVIVSDVTPLREIVTHGKTGLIHVKDDVADLKRQLEIFIENETVRASCGKEARLWVEQTRNWQTITGQVASLYEKMTGLNSEALGQSFGS